MSEDDSFSSIGSRLSKKLINTTGNLANILGNTTELGTKLTNTGIEGSLKAADKITEASTDAVGRVGVASAESVATVGESGTRVVNTAAKAVAGTAETMYDTAAKIKDVAAAKGNAYAEDSIAVSEAKTQAINDPGNIEKRNNVAREVEKMKLTQQEYSAEQNALKKKANHETKIMDEQIKAVKRTSKKSGQLTSVQNDALIKAANAKRKVLDAEQTASRIEMEAMKEIECRDVLEIAADKPSAIHYDELNNTVSQNKFCKYKRICASTGKPLGRFNLLGSNKSTCSDVRSKYKTFQDMSAGILGGRKMTRKIIKRKKNTRRLVAKKKTRKHKKNTRKPKKKTKKRKKTRTGKKRYL